MATKAQLGIGTKLQYGDNSSSPETFTTLAEAMGISISILRETLDVTNQDSTDNFREYIEGLQETEEFTIECNLAGNGGTGDAGLDPSHDAVMGYQEAGGARTWRILETLADASTREFRFEAIVLGYSLDFPVEGQKTITFTFRPTGPLTRFNQ